jgi:hypothetical protein
MLANQLLFANCNSIRYSNVITHMYKTKERASAFLELTLWRAEIEENKQYFDAC